MSEKCETHRFPKSFMCLSPNCSNPTVACVLCIKTLHEHCKDEFLLPAEEAKTKVNVCKRGENVKKLCNRLEEFMDNEIFSMQVDMKKKRAQVVRELMVDESEIPNQDVWNYLKKSSKITIDPETSVITLRSLVDMTPENEKKGIEIFQESFKAITDKFLKEFNQLRFRLPGEMRMDSWKGHDSIKMTETDKGLAFSRVPGSNESIFEIRYWSVPLSNCKIQVTIDAIRNGDRYLDIGIFDQSTFDSIKQTNVLSFSNSFASYCGYSLNKMTGKSFTSSSSDPNGFAPKRQFTVEFAQEKPLRMTSECGKVDLTATNSCQIGMNYYFYICLHYPESACTVLMLN